LNHKPKHIGFKLFVTLGITILVLLVAMIAMALADRFSFKRYQQQMMYCMGGSTSQVTAIGDEGDRVLLAKANRRTFYTFMSDGYGTRTHFKPAELTGRSFTFTAESAVGKAEGRVSETESEFVLIDVTVGDENWTYYFDGRYTYDQFAKIVSPGGWFEANPVLPDKN